MASIALIDDHKIFCDSLTSLINDFPGFQVVWCEQNGNRAIDRLQREEKLPDIILLDIVMPVLNGVAVAKWISENLPDLKVLALTMEEDDNSVIKMLHYGIRGYLLKDVGAEELKHALDQVMRFGFYYTPIIASNIHRRLSNRPTRDLPELTARERQLLEYLCTDLSYSEIARKIFLSESTIDTYRARLFEKFEVKNRIGLVLKAVHNNLVKL